MGHVKDLPYVTVLFNRNLFQLLPPSGACVWDSEPATQVTLLVSASHPYPYPMFILVLGNLLDR
jgi:hypothetical protein